MSGLKFILQSDQIDGANAMARLLPPRSGFLIVRKRSLREAVAEVMGKCGTMNKIQTIYIIGHGSTEGQEFGEIGADMLQPTSITAMLLQKPELPKPPPRVVAFGPQPPLRRPGGVTVDGVHLMHKLCPYYVLDGTGELILGGCRVGAGDTVRLLSKVMKNIVVSGFNMAQLPTGCGDAGAQIFYKDGICVRIKAHYTLTTVLSLLPTLAQASGVEQ